MPQPVDFQTEVGRITAAERIQQIADRTSLAAQQRHAVEEDESRILQETAPHEPEPKGEEVDREMRRRNPFAGRRQKRGHQEPPGDAEPDGAPRDPQDVAKTAGEEHHLDVTV
ncbi:MAG TPA: hypothetical protein PLO37_05430 [Candidatus Hydrogenedentes bacterium]|nr:hypothetical protein [Candidatus Hydrogenedentota bacterium]HPG66268.1 hypothetical protein [Candidatus Hydrogenedentota bacterium]